MSLVIFDSRYHFNLLMLTHTASGSIAQRSGTGFHEFGLHARILKSEYERYRQKSFDVSFIPCHGFFLVMFARVTDPCFN